MRKIAYVCADDRHRLLFASTLQPLGVDRLDYFPWLKAALEHLSGSDEYLAIVIHGRISGMVVDEEALRRVREVTGIPVLLLGFSAEGWHADAHGQVVLVPRPVTAAALTQAVAGLRDVPHPKLVKRLRRSPGFKTFSETALAYLLGRAEAAQLLPGEVLFDEGDPGDSMFFVITGLVEITIAGKEVEQVGPGGILGEMAMLAGHVRSAAARAVETTVALEVGGEALHGSDADFRAIFFELVARTLVDRLRRTSGLLLGVTDGGANAVLPERPQ